MDSNLLEGDVIKEGKRGGEAEYNLSIVFEGNTCFAHSDGAVPVLAVGSKRGLRVVFRDVYTRSCLGGVESVEAGSASSGIKVVVDGVSDRSGHLVGRW
jgi:hypothetical protein